MTTSSYSWGELIEKTLNMGREDWSSKYKKIEPNDPLYKTFTHHSHAMIYAKTNSMFQNFPLKAVVLMQLKYDGYIGFPGGVIEEESPIGGLHRQLREQLGWDDKKELLTNAHHQFSHVHEEEKKVFHFYSVEITERKMEEIEHNLAKAPNYGREVFGNIRVPLFIMGDAFKGFPSFLRNHFGFNAKLQLTQTLINLKFLTEEQIVQALYSAPLITS